MTWPEVCSSCYRAEKQLAWIPPQSQPWSNNSHYFPTSPILLKPAKLLNICRALSVDFKASLYTLG